MFCAFVGEGRGLIDSRFVVIVNGCVVKIVREMEISWEMTDAKLSNNAGVCGSDLGFTGATRCFICWMDFHAMGPPEWQIRYPKRDLNLKSSRGMPSRTALPNCPPQHVSVKAVRREHSTGDGGVASVYASQSWCVGKWLYACVMCALHCCEKKCHNRLY